MLIEPGLDRGAQAHRERKRSYAALALVAITLGWLGGSAVEGTAQAEPVGFFPVSATDLYFCCVDGRSFVARRSAQGWDIVNEDGSPFSGAPAGGPSGLSNNVLFSIHAGQYEGQGFFERAPDVLVYFRVASPDTATATFYGLEQQARSATFTRTGEAWRKSGDINSQTLFAMAGDNTPDARQALGLPDTLSSLPSAWNAWADAVLENPTDRSFHTYADSAGNPRWMLVVRIPEEEWPAAQETAVAAWREPPPPVAPPDPPPEPWWVAYLDLGLAALLLATGILLGARMARRSSGGNVFGEIVSAKDELKGMPEVLNHLGNVANAVSEEITKVESRLRPLQRAFDGERTIEELIEAVPTLWKRMKVLDGVEEGLPEVEQVVRDIASQAREVLQAVQSPVRSSIPHLSGAGMSDLRTTALNRALVKVLEDLNAALVAVKDLRRNRDEWQSQAETTNETLIRLPKLVEDLEAETARADVLEASLESMKSSLTAVGDTVTSQTERITELRTTLAAGEAKLRAIRAVTLRMDELQYGSFQVWDDHRDQSSAAIAYLVSISVLNYLASLLREEDSSQVGAAMRSNVQRISDGLRGGQTQYKQVLEALPHAPPPDSVPDGRDASVADHIARLLNDLRADHQISISPFYIIDYGKLYRFDQRD